MSENPDDILQPWDAEAFVENLEPSDLEKLGTKVWFEFHKKLMLLNQQSILEISTLREECIKEWFVTFHKIPILIYEAIQIAVWKNKVFSLLIELNGEPTNTFMLYSVFYHEGIAVSLLENVLFHADSAEMLDDSAIDLVDYAVNNVTGLIFGKNCPVVQADKNSCLEELYDKRTEMEFDISIKCISILRYLAEYSEKLPLSVLSRMLSTHDVPYLLCQLIEKQPWKKNELTDDVMIYNGKWEKVESNERDKLSKVEAQVWIGLRQLLLNPASAPYYEITERRISELTKIQKYLQEHVLDQIAPLIDLRHWLSYLNMSPQSSTAKPPLSVEVVPQIKSLIIEKHHKKWKRLAKQQSKYLFTKDMDHIINMAQILREAYDIDKVNYDVKKKCALCKDNATKKCSQCKEVWYCSRECQVNDWTNHKNTCVEFVKLNQTFGAVN